MGPLHGKVNPQEVSWALLDYGIADTYKHKAYQYLQISLEKGAMYKDIWATVLNKEYVTSLLSPEELAKRKAEFEQYNKPIRKLTPPTPPSSEPASGLKQGEEMGFIDFEVDDEGNLLSQSEMQHGDGETLNFIK